MSERYSFHELLLRHARETADVYVVELAARTDPPGALHVDLRTRAWRYDPWGVAAALRRQRDPGEGGGTRPLDRASAREAARRLGAELPGDVELDRLMTAGREREEADRRARAAAVEQARSRPPAPPPAPVERPEPTWWVQHDLDGVPVALLVHQDAGHGLAFDPVTAQWRDDPRWVWTRVHDEAERATGLVRQVTADSARWQLHRWEVEAPTDDEVRAGLAGHPMVVVPQPLPPLRFLPSWWQLADGDAPDDRATVVLAELDHHRPLRAARLRAGRWEPVAEGLAADLVSGGRPTGRVLRQCSWTRARRVAALSGTDLPDQFEGEALLGPRPEPTSFYEVRSPDTGALLTVLLAGGHRTVVLRPDKACWELDVPHGSARLTVGELLAGHTVAVDGARAGRALDELGQPWPTQEQVDDLWRGRRDHLPARGVPVPEDLDLEYEVRQQVGDGPAARVTRVPGAVVVRARGRWSGHALFDHRVGRWRSLPGRDRVGLDPEEDLHGSRTVGRVTAEQVTAAGGATLPSVPELRALLELDQ